MANDVIKNGVVALLFSFLLAEVEPEPEERERWKNWLFKNFENLPDDGTFTTLIDSLLQAVDQANASVPTQPVAQWQKRHADEELAAARALVARAQEMQS